MYLPVDYKCQYGIGWCDTIIGYKQFAAIKHHLALIITWMSDHTIIQRYSRAYQAVKKVVRKRFLLRITHNSRQKKNKVLIR